MNIDWDNLPMEVNQLPGMVEIVEKWSLRDRALAHAVITIANVIEGYGFESGGGFLFARVITDPLLFAGPKIARDRIAEVIAHALLIRDYLKGFDSASDQP